MFQPYTPLFLEPCLALFDLNTPTYFATNERDDYLAFLSEKPDFYQIGVLDNEVVAAFGLVCDKHAKRGRINWIMVNPHAHGKGIGRKMMQHSAALAMDSGVNAIDIAASHLSAPFFAKFGAEIVLETPDGWGQGMHRVDMVLKVRSSPDKKE